MEYKAVVKCSDRLQKTNVGSSTLIIPIHEVNDNKYMAGYDCRETRKIAIFRAQSKSW